MLLNVTGWRRSNARSESKSQTRLFPSAVLTAESKTLAMSASDAGRRKNIMARRSKSNRETGNMPTQRALRAGELVRHAVAEIFARGDVHDPVLEVRMSPDLRMATIYVMPLGGKDTKDVLTALDRNKKFLRGEIAHRVNLKFAPDIRFMLDERFDEAERIDKLLRTPAVRRDLDEDDGK